MQAVRHALLAFLLLRAYGAGAGAYNFNLDWKFSRLPAGIAGLPAARLAIARDGKEFFDPKFDDSAWEDVSLPHPVNARDSYDGRSVWWGEEEFFRGWMFYRKKFVAPKGRHFFLEFESVRNSVYLWVNGKFVGFYEAGIVASGYDITSFVKDGDNTVAVATENCAARAVKIFAAETSTGGEPGDWKGTLFQWDSTDYNPVQGGLAGNVNLYAKEHDSYFTLPLYETLRTTGTYVYAKDFDFAEGSATVCVEPEIEGKGNVRFTVNGQTFTGREGRVKGLVFWAPATPRLYDVGIELLDDGGRVLDEITVRTGFRKVEYDRDRGGLLVNGRSVWLPGYAQRSTDSWAAIGVAVDWLHDYDAELVRASNANFVRWMHVAPKPAPVRAFDKAGIVNVCPAGDTEKDAEGRQWEQRMEAMRAAIVYFRNSPSIFFWEAGNNQITPAHMREMRLLKESLDANGGRFMGCRSLVTPEQIAEAEYVGTMIHRHDKAAFASMEKLGRFLPIIESEYCREECARRLWDRFSPPDYNFVCRRLSTGMKRNGYNCFDMTQEDFAVSNGSVSDGYAYFYGKRVSGNLGRFYCGCAMLCWSDCNQHGRNADTENCRSSGRVDAVRIPKENFYAHQCFYSSVPKVKILGHWNYPKFGPDTYWYSEAVNDGTEITYSGPRRQRDPKRKTVVVIASVHCASVELYVNGKSKGINREPDGLFDFKFHGIDVTESGRVEAVAYDLDGNVIASDAIETVGGAARLEMRITTGPDGFRADGSDIAIVDLSLVDGKGRTLPLANDRVTFRLSGPATFMGGWNSGTFGETSPIGKDWVNLECGVNRVFIKSGRKAGTVVLKAACGKFTSEVSVKTKSVPVRGGLCLLPQQAYAANRARNVPQTLCQPVRDVESVPGNVSCDVTVNGAKVDFGKCRPPFKPDAATGVCAALGPVLAAVKSAGAAFDYETFGEEIPVAKSYLRDIGFVSGPVVSLKIGKKKIVDAVAGATELLENGGTVRNLTNFEFSAEGETLTGELASVLGYVPGVTSAFDARSKTFSITVARCANVGNKSNAKKEKKP